MKVCLKVYKKDESFIHYFVIRKGILKYIEIFFFVCEISGWLVENAYIR